MGVTQDSLSELRASEFDINRIPLLRGCRKLPLVVDKAAKCQNSNGGHARLVCTGPCHV